MSETFVKLDNISADVRDMQVIADAINEYEQLKAENERLKQENDKLKYALEIDGDDTVAIISQKYFDTVCASLQEYQEAFKKCSPWIYETDIQDYFCYDCRKPEGTEHTENCSYVRLCGGAENG